MAMTIQTSELVRLYTCGEGHGHVVTYTCLVSRFYNMTKRSGCKWKQKKDYILILLSM